MKRVFSLLLSVLLLANVAFAKNFFSSRFFEIRTTVPLGLSNNVITLNDIFVKDLVIDLKKINSEVPKTGLTTILHATPEVSTKINIKGVSVAVNTGVDIYGKLNISKGLFDLLGEGYTVGDTIDISFVDPVLDTFAYVNVPIGFNIGKFSINVAPATFLPVIAMNNSNISLTMQNKEDGSIKANFTGDMNFYATGALNLLDTNNFSMNLGSLGKYLGFDLGASVGYKLNKMISFRADTKIPIVPGRMDKNLNVRSTFDVAADSILEFKPENSKTENSQKLTDLETTLKINRPLKLNAYANFNLLGFLEFTGGGGFGIRRPFSSSFYVYPEYYLSAKVSLFDMIQCSLSTEYTNQLFIHSLNAVLNFRIIELDLGISMESSNFAKSFSTAGFGAYVGLAIGF